MGSTAGFANPATHFGVVADATGSVGVPYNLTVTALDDTPATDTTYAGTVHFQIQCCGGGYGSTLPADSTLTNGVGTFQVTPYSAGSIVINVYDTANSGINGNSNPTLVPDVTSSQINLTPGATLLFPYFEVDPNSATGRNTLLSLENNSATAILGHTTIWTDLGVPVLTFNIYLTGYDIASIDLQDMFVNGNLPTSASAGQDPTDQISPKGQFSQDINFASCGGFGNSPQLPYQPGALLPATRLGLRNALTGHASTLTSNMCSGFNHGDSILRGYVTIDTVNNCTERMPTDVGYFVNGGSGDATNQNVMTGEYFLYDAGLRLMQADAAVPVHADSARYSTLGDYTFYGRIDQPAVWNTADNRQPLPNTWAVDAQTAGTELIVWRDIKIAPTSFSCAQPVPPSSGLPLGQERAFSFDNQEQPLAIPVGTPFGLATQRVALGTAGFPLPAKPGWVYLGLGYQNTAVSSANAPADTKADQAFVSVLQYPESHATSTGTGAIALDQGSAAQHTHPND